MSRDEDDDEKYIARFGNNKKTLCLKKYTTKDSKGNKVTRRCIKKKNHWWGHK